MDFPAVHNMTSLVRKKEIGALKNITEYDIAELQRVTTSFL